MPAVATAATSCGSSGLGVGLEPAVPVVVVLPTWKLTCWSVALGLVRTPNVTSASSARMAVEPIRVKAVLLAVPEAFRPLTAYFLIGGYLASGVANQATLFRSI